MQIYTVVWKLHVFNPKINQILNKSIKFWFLQITGSSNWLNWLVSRCRGPVVSTEKLWWLWGIWLYWNENNFSLLMVAFHLRLMQTVFILFYPPLLHYPPLGVSEHVVLEQYLVTGLVASQLKFMMWGCGNRGPTGSQLAPHTQRKEAKHNIMLSYTIPLFVPLC